MSTQIRTIQVRDRWILIDYVFHFRIHYFEAHHETKNSYTQKIQIPIARCKQHGQGHRGGHVICQYLWNDTMSELLCWASSWLPTRRQILLWTARSRVSASSFLAMLSIWCDGQSMTWDWVEISSSFYFVKNHGDKKACLSFSEKIKVTLQFFLSDADSWMDWRIDWSPYRAERTTFWPV